MCEIYYLHIWNEHVSQNVFHSFSGNRSISRLSNNNTQAFLVLPAFSNIHFFIMRKYYLTEVTETTIKENNYSKCVL